MQAEIQTQNQGENHDDEQADEEGPPLEFARSPCVVNTLRELNIGLFRVLDHVLGLFFGRLHGRFLDDDGLGEVLEELVELLEGTLDLEDIVVAKADCAKDRGCGTGAVGFELVGCVFVSIRLMIARVMKGASRIE